jgi:AcrR family transcriptional regulator
MEVEGMSPPVAGRRDAKRDAIHRAAIEQFAQRGFAGTSMANIAEAADMSRPALYQYFRDKNDIFTSAFVALFEELVEQALSALHQPGSTVQQLDGYLQRYEGDLWERMATSPYAEEIVRSKNADVVAAIATVVARLSDGLTAYLEHRSADPRARAELVELLRWSPKGFTYDRPSVEAFRRRLTALARVIAASLDVSS